LTQYPLGTGTQTLTYDAASRITGTAHTNPVYNRGYTYDALDRLTGQSDSTSFRLWTYDANSNRTSVQSGSNLYPYTVDTNSNRLLSVAGPVSKTYTYDAAGNSLNDGIAAYTWNAAGRLLQVDRNSKTYLSQYNGLGERVNKGEYLGSNGQYFFAYDAAGHLIGENQENLATPQPDDWLLGQETVWFGDIPVAVIKQASPTDPIQVYYIHADHLNTPRVIVDATNTPIWQWTNQNAFGDNLPNEDPDGDSNLFEYNLRFAGQYFDNETRLHDNYFRDYDHENGRYVSSDPIGLTGGLNTYGYSLQNPSGFTDRMDKAAPTILEKNTMLHIEIKPVFCCIYNTFNYLSLTINMQYKPTFSPFTGEMQQDFSRGIFNQNQNKTSKIPQKVGRFPSVWGAILKKWGE
jgi:RHS repeat-associated protein